MGPDRGAGLFEACSDWARPIGIVLDVSLDQRVLAGGAHALTALNLQSDPYLEDRHLSLSFQDTPWQANVCPPVRSVEPRRREEILHDEPEAGKRVAEVGDVMVL